MDPWQRLRIANRTDWTAGLLSLTLEGSPASFSPGQFVNLRAEAGGALLKRPYSLASAPGQDYEFLVSRVPEGALTPALFELRQGDRVEVETKANGLFTLDWLPDFAAELWLLATGTGLGPFMSFLRTPGLLFPRFEQVRLVHCVRTHAQLAYAPELSALAAAESRFKYLPMLSREQRLGSLSGRIPAQLKAGALETAGELRFSKQRSHFMLCGNPDMIRDAQAELAARGFDKHRRRQPGHVTTEKYWT